MGIRMALAGNPNSGKTTLFNVLTGANQTVGNWPGVTVEKKEGSLIAHPDVTVQDLPGIYSLSPYSPEERITRRYLVEDPPDVILNIVDGANLERNLYLTTQLLELGLPMVLAVNRIDVVQKQEGQIQLDKLSQALGCPCVAISALKNTRCLEAAELAVRQAVLRGELCQRPQIFQGSVKNALDRIQIVLYAKVKAEQRHWFAVKLFERDPWARQISGLNQRELDELEADIVCCEREMDDEAAALIANQRYSFVSRITADTAYKGRAGPSVSQRIDAVFMDRVLALPMFALVLLCMYTIAMGSMPFSIGTVCGRWVGQRLFGVYLPEFCNGIFQRFPVSGWLRSLVLDGVVTGVGAVLSFAPQILVLSFLLAILEDVGYLARVAFIMDRIARRFGLSGKSIIPMLVATGCGVPGILACRTIEQERSRRITVMTTCFLPCSAKMPMVGLFAGAVFGNSPWIAAGAFLLGSGAVALSGLILKKTRPLAGQAAPFVMELPDYHLPSVKHVLRGTVQRGRDYLYRAVSVVALSSMLLWFLQNYRIWDGLLLPVEDRNQSLLACLGRSAAWLFSPLGWSGDMAWKAVVATVTGLSAKEQIVMSLGTLYRQTGELGAAGSALWARFAADFGPARAVGFLILNLLCAPCVAAMSAIHREMGSAKWTAAAIGYMCAFAYGLAMIAYQFLGLLTGEASFGIGTVAAAGLLAGILYLAVRRPRVTVSAPDACSVCQGCHTGYRKPGRA